jgi:hypothetical protein
VPLSLITDGTSNLWGDRAIFFQAGCCRQRQYAVYSQLLKFTRQQRRGVARAQTPKQPAKGRGEHRLPSLAQRLWFALPVGQIPLFRVVSSATTGIQAIPVLLKPYREGPHPYTYTKGGGNNTETHTQHRISSSDS